ncbi:MAG: hypothetical protein ABJF67_03655 [Aurantimonas coralicida]|uniref:hypothetical protein n=1 Tax=Aurantimonas TaxID=182269 RepID=UPI00040992DB|nr:hypothetical protein [Aurantimonas coralicida]
MVTTDLNAILVRCEAATATDAALEAELRTALHEHASSVESAADADLALASADGALAMVAKTLPGWSIILRGGTGPGGHWHCVLREGEGHHDDQTVAAARGNTPAMAIATATLKAIAGFKAGYR